MTQPLEGKVVIVTGGSRGIGRAAALKFAREGARVIIAARGAEQGNRVVNEIKSTGGQTCFVATDVSRSEEVDRLVTTAVQTFGRVDCAFNNAASIGGARRTDEFTEEEFDREIASNLKSVWLCMKYEIAQMRRQDPKGGAIVNTSSVNGLGGVRNASLYAAAKAGVLALTKSAALEYAPEGIRVNALVAGAFATDMLAQVMVRASGGDPGARTRIEERYVSLVPLGRIGRPEEAAEAAVWLCSEASSYLTGHALIVDGGMTAWAR